MAKGIQSHVKKRNNAALQVEAAKNPSVGDHMEEVSNETTTKDAMVTDEPAKISTSGPRKNSKYLRDAKLKQKKLNKKNKKKTTNKF
ncbi:unnamed protein product [Absidia cylindrospora]